MDGGTVWNVDIDAAIRQCLDGVVDNPSKIVVDIMITDQIKAIKPIEGH